MKTFLITLVLSLFFAMTAVAEEEPLSGHTKYMYFAIKSIILRAAETMPEEHYDFAPVETVRTFGKIVGHLADTQYAFCSIASGEKNPAPQIEKTKSTKADLVAALTAAIAYCESAYAALDDTSGAQKVKLMRTEAPRLGVLNVNNAHTMEHYGNLVTYMRMKGLVPPTSEPEFMRQLSR